MDQEVSEWSWLKTIRRSIIYEETLVFDKMMTKLWIDDEEASQNIAFIL